MSISVHTVQPGNQTPSEVKAVPSCKKRQTIHRACKLAFHIPQDF